jgi:hypothetical protein
MHVYVRQSCFRLTVLFFLGIRAIPGASIPPARWDLQTPEGKKFPRVFEVAIGKYAPEYTSADASTAAKIMLGIFRTGNAGAVGGLAGLSNDILLPVGDALLAGAVQYSDAKRWLKNQGTHANDRDYDQVQERMFRSMSVIVVATRVLHDQCDARTLPLLGRFSFSNATDGRSTGSLMGGSSPDDSMQQAINQAIQDISSGACKAPARTSQKSSPPAPRAQPSKSKALPKR